jgi:hypothetical protein
VQLEQKFHEYFYYGNTKLRHLTTIKQKHNESTTEYIRRFRDTRNWCFNLNISDKDLPDLAYSGLTPHLKDKLESHIFSDVIQVCSGLWIVEAEPRSLGVSLGLMIRLGMSITLTWVIIVVSHRTTKRPTCA